MVTAADACAATGLALPATSATAPAAICGMTVPSEQLLMVTVTEVPLAADTPKVQPVAVPVLVKSPASMPVTASAKVSVNACDALLVGLGGGVHDAVVGVRSMVTAAASRSATGPALLAASVTAPATSRGVTVPSEQPLTTTFTDVPVDADGVNTQPVAVPWFVKSAAAMPSADSPNVIGNVMLAALVGEAGAVPQVAVGPVRSILTAVAVAALAGPLLAATSDTLLAASTGVTVPSVHPLAVTVTDVPVAAEGVKVQPVAVPALLKSLATMPDTGSLKVSVNTGDVALVGVLGDAHDAVGGTRSTVTVGAGMFAPGKAAFDPSSTAFCSSVSATVPEVPLAPPMVTA